MRRVMVARRSGRLRAPRRHSCFLALPVGSLRLPSPERWSALAGTAGMGARTRISQRRGPRTLSQRRCAETLSAVGCHFHRSPRWMFVGPALLHADFPSTAKAKPIQNRDLVNPPASILGNFGRVGSGFDVVYFGFRVAASRGRATQGTPPSVPAAQRNRPFPQSPAAHTLYIAHTLEVSPRPRRAQQLRRRRHWPASSDRLRRELFILSGATNHARACKNSPSPCRSKTLTYVARGPVTTRAPGWCDSPRSPVKTPFFFTLKIRDCTNWPKMRAFGTVEARHRPQVCARQQRTRPRVYLKLSSTRFDPRLTPLRAGTSWWQFLASPAS